MAISVPEAAGETALSYVTSATDFAVGAHTRNFVAAAK
ncbi:unannotated protein [freshwater metagenome]|uniref:Unannotated protein n=1 Tax=freshwater metagenome TaxID=449393 RepID=A0A6J5ZF61_9ZZZZ